MNSLIHQARTISSVGSSRSSPQRRPTREDRFILEHYHSKDGNTHKSLLTDIVLDGNVFKKDRTSLTRSCNNIVSRNQFILQALQNIAHVMACLRYQLTVSGTAMRDQGMLYDPTFPDPLRQWIMMNVKSADQSNISETELDEDILKSLIGQLIMINSICGDLV